MGRPNSLIAALPRGGYRGKVALLVGPTPDWGCPPIQVCRQCDMVDLEDLDGGREEFSELNAPHLVEHVAEGRIYSNGVDGDKQDAA